MYRDLTTNISMFNIEKRSEVVFVIIFNEKAPTVLVAVPSSKGHHFTAFATEVTAIMCRRTDVAQDMWEVRGSGASGWPVLGPR